MKKIKQFVRNPFFILSCITALFFWAVILKGYVPFPGDLLLSEYNPWRHTSYFGYVEGSIPSKAQYFDVIRELYPWKTLVIDQLKKGHIPLWNPYNFSGAPLLANYQSQVFYPLSALYLVLPQPLAWTVLVILQLLLGSIFMYLFATSIGLSSAASILAAVLFNYSSFSTVWLEFNTVWHTILWIPLILYITELRLKRPLGVLAKLIFVFSLFSSMTAGHPQDFINSLLFMISYNAARILFLPDKSPKEKLFITADLGLLICCTFLIGAAQLLPTIQFFTSSARVPHDVQYVIHNMLIQIWQLPITIISDFFGNPATRTYVLPDTYVNKSISIGVIGFVLATVSLWSKKTFHVKYFISVAATLFILSINTPLSQLFYRFPIPILSTGTPTRNLFVYIFCLSMLAAIGYDSLKERKSLRKPILLLSMLFAIIFAGYVVKPTLFYHFELTTIAAIKKSFIFAVGLFICGVGSIYMAKKFSMLRTCLIVLVVVELFIGFKKFNAFVPSTYVFPSNELFTYLQQNAGLNRFWGYGTAQIEANFATQYHIYSPDGTDPLNLKWYNALVQSTDDGNMPKVFTRSTRSDAYVHPGYGIKDLPENPFRLRVLDALGVRFILDRAENPKDSKTFDPERFTMRWQKDSWTVYENILAAPRFFLTSKIKYYSTDDEFEKIFFDPSFDPRSAITMPHTNNMITVDEGSRVGTVDLITYQPNDIQFTANTDKPQYLFLSDTYDKGWKSYIDDKQTSTMKADYAFRAVYVPAGKHTIRMSYRPDEFMYGLILSGVGFVLLSGLLLIPPTHKKRSGSRK